MRYEIQKATTEHWTIYDHHAQDYVRGINGSPRKVNRPLKAQRIVERLIAGGTAMSAEAFTSFVERMVEQGLATSGADIAEKLGVTVASIANFKARGADRRTALAASALLAGLPPYKGE